MLKELKENKKLIFILILFLILPFFRFPDLRNEMKYLNIIQEMIEKKSYWILYYQGGLYPDKPPLYFWLLIIIYKIFGENLVFPLSLILFSYLPFLGILFLGYWQLGYLKKEWRNNFLIYSLTIPFLMGVSNFLRMDMLITFFISLVLSLFVYFYYNQGKITKIKLFVFYFCIFLGVFTKGALGIIFPILIIFMFLYFENNFNFFNLLHWKKGLIFLIFCFSLWFSILYQQPEGKEYIYLLFNKQTVGRAYKSFSHSRPFYYYFVYIPLTFFPYGLFYIYGFFKYLKNWKKKREWTLFEKWTFSWSIPPLILLSVVSGKLQIYMLPICIGMIFLSLIVRDELIEKYSIIKNIEKYIQNFIIILYAFLPIGLFIYTNYFKP